MKDDEKAFIEFLKFMYEEKVTIKKDIDTFIKEHEHINYCEAIIFKNAKIGYVNPSHQETLMRETDHTKEELNKMIPITESVLNWLLDYTECIAVWTNGYMLPRNKNISAEQKEVLHKLINENLVENYEIKN